MGKIGKLLEFTPFYKQYKKYQQIKTFKNQQKLEESLMPLRVKFYKQFINSSDLVFDIGANIGNRVDAFLLCNAKVVAVEPQPSCVNVLGEKFGDRITIENIGLNDTEGELEMTIASDSTVSSFSNEYINKTQKRFRYSKWEEKIKVPVMTLDSLIKKYGVPKFCKIDVEGFELQVLKGLHNKIPYLSIEYCVPEMEDENIKCLSHLNLLAPNATFNYSIGESMEFVLPDWMSFENFIQHIKLKEFIKTSFGDIYVRSV